jgi:hypothetical protein
MVAAASAFDGRRSGVRRKHVGNHIDKSLRDCQRCGSALQRTAASGLIA